MKKLFRLMTICVCICSVFTFASCGSEQAKAENMKNTESTVTTESSQTDSQVEETEESEALPDKETLQAVPDEAVDALNDVIEQSKDDFFDAEGKFLYGYQGVQKINKVDCYIFVVYNKNKDIYKNLGTYASVVKTGELYKLNVNTNKFEKSVLTHKTQELSWADTETESFEKYLSADKESGTQKKSESKKISKTK